MNQVNIILLCSSRFALHALKEMLFMQQVKVVAVPKHCDDMVQQLQLLLQGSAVPVVTVDKENCTATLTRVMKKYEVNLGIMMTFSYKITQTVYSLAAKGFYNVHPGPLPRYRGSDPIFRQIANQEKLAGVTVHQLDNGMDTGPVVLQEMIRLETNDTYGLLNSKLAVLAAKLTGIVCRMASLGVAIPTRAQDETKAVYYKKQLAPDITINWENDAASIVALINACNPWNKGAVSMLNGNFIRLLEAEQWTVVPDMTVRPGVIMAFENDSMIVATKGGSIKVWLIYIDEGFLTAGRLFQLGVQPGNFFLMTQ